MREIPVAGGFSDRVSRVLGGKPESFCACGPCAGDGPTWRTAGRREASQFALEGKRGRVLDEPLNRLDGVTCRITYGRWLRPSLNAVGPALVTWKQATSYWLTLWPLPLA